MQHRHHRKIRVLEIAAIVSTSDFSIPRRVYHSVIDQLLFTFSSIADIVIFSTGPVDKMDGSREPKDLFPDPAKKMDQQQPNNVPPVKRPRQKGHHFDMLANVQRQPRSDYPADLSMQIQGTPFSF